MVSTTAAVGAISSLPGKKIVTWHTLCARGNFDMQDAVIETTSFAKLNRLWRREPFVVITVRQFTDRIHVESGLPIKCLHAFHVTRQGVQKASAADVEMAHNTDAATGQPISPEIAVEYC